MDLAALQGLLTALAVIAGVSGLLVLLAWMEPRQVVDPLPAVGHTSDEPHDA